MLERIFNKLESLAKYLPDDTDERGRESGLQRTHTVMCTCQGLQCPGRINDSWGKDL